MARGTTWRLERTALLAIILIGWALALHRLGERSLWADEGFTAHLAQGGLANLRYDHSPLHQLLITGVVRWSRSEMALRLPSAAAAVLTLPVLYLLGRRLMDGPSGLVAALLLAISPFAINYAQEARSYAMLQLLASSSLLLLLRALEGKAWWWAGYTLAATMMLYTHHFGWLALGAGMALAVIILAQSAFERGRLCGLSLAALLRDRRLVALAASLGGIAILYLPWAPSLAAFMRTDLSGPDSLPPGLRLFEPSVQFLKDMIYVFGAQAGGWRFYLFGAFALAGVLALIAGRKWRCLAAIGLWFAVPIAFLAVVRSRRFFEFRYLIFQLPVFLLLVAHGIVAVVPSIKGAPGPRHEAARRAVLAFALGVCLFVPADLPALRSYYAWEKENWRGIAALLHDNMEADEVIYVAPRYWANPLLYYRPDLASYLVGGTADSEEQLEQAAAGAAGVWFLRYAGPIGDTTGRLTEWITGQGFQLLVDGGQCGYGIHVYYRRFDEQAQVREDALWQEAVAFCPTDPRFQSPP